MDLLFTADLREGTWINVACRFSGQCTYSVSSHLLSHQVVVQFGGARLLTRQCGASKKCCGSRGRSPHPSAVCPTGGASVLASRRADSLSAPSQIEHPAFEWPVLNSLNQPLADGIFLHVNPLLRIVFAVAQPMMPATRLKLPFRWGERPREPLAFHWWGEHPRELLAFHWWGERPREPSLFQRKFTFPIGNPCFHGEVQIFRRTKQVEMVRHQQIITNKPGCCL